MKPAVKVQRLAAHKFGGIVVQCYRAPSGQMFVVCEGGVPLRRRRKKRRA